MKLLRHPIKTRRFQIGFSAIKSRFVSQILFVYFFCSSIKLIRISKLLQFVSFKKLHDNLNLFQHRNRLDWASGVVIKMQEINPQTSPCHRNPLIMQNQFLNRHHKFNNNFTPEIYVIWLIMQLINALIMFKQKKLIFICSLENIKSMLIWKVDVRDKKKCHDPDRDEFHVK